MANKFQYCVNSYHCHVCRILHRVKQWYHRYYNISMVVYTYYIDSVNSNLLHYKSLTSIQAITHFLSPGFSYETIKSKSKNIFLCRYVYVLCTQANEQNFYECTKSTLWASKMSFPRLKCRQIFAFRKRLIENFAREERLLAEGIDILYYV